MPKPIRDFITELAIKAGVSSEDEKLRSVVSEIVNISVPDELVTAIDSGLLNIEAAKNNHPDIRAKYQADVLDVLDRQIAKLIDEEDFTPNEIEKIKSVHSTKQKFELVLSKLKELKASAKPEDKTAINKQIADLNELVRVTKEDKANTVKDYEGKIKDIRKDAVLVGLLGSYKTIYDELDPGIKTASLTAIINKALQDNDAVLDVSDNGTLTLVRKDGSNVFGSDHRQHTPQSFLDKTLAPILKVSNSGPKPVNGVLPQQQVVAGNGSTNEIFKEHTQKVLAEMAKTTDVI